jgi:hypothetical protein
MSMQKPILPLFLLAGAITARAGSPDGLNLVVIAHPSAAGHARAVERFVADARTSGIQCGKYVLNLEHVYTTPPARLTSELATAALHDKTGHKRLAKLLTGFRDKTIERGFDAALAYEVRDGQLRFHGISGASDERPVTTTLALDAAGDRQKFNAAACKAVANLPVLAEP